MKYLTKPVRELPKGLPTMNDRIEYLRCVLGYPIGVFATKVGAMTASLKKVLEGKNLPNIKILSNILAILPVRQEWLYMGTGNPFSANDISRYLYSNEKEAADVVDTDVNDRIKEIRKDKGLSQPIFGPSIGVSKDIIASIETGRSSITVPTLKRLIKKYNINEMWLLWGHGNKYKK